MKEDRVRGAPPRISSSRFASGQSCLIMALAGFLSLVYEPCLVASVIRQIIKAEMSQTRPIVRMLVSKDL